MLYSGDKPNPDLRRFVEAHLKDAPFDPTSDAYDIEEFDRPINTNKNSPIYGCTRITSARSHSTRSRHILSITPPRATSCWTRSAAREATALASLTLGRKAVAIDASPAATFITRFCVAPCDPEDLKRRFYKLCRDVKSEMDDLYTTRCHLCRGLAMIHHVVYSNIYECPSCLRQVSLYEASAHIPPCCPTCLPTTASRAR